MKAKELLEQLNACQEAIEWAGDMTVQEAWDACHRGDWMLWFYGKQYPENIKELALAKGHCANTVRHLMKDKRSIAAVDAAIAFGEGKITHKELCFAATAAYADYATSAYAATAAYAADAAAYAGDAAADAADAADAATARKQNQQQTADICRKYLELK